jgi:membrane-associated phospholipid phosphatase
VNPQPVRAEGVGASRGAALVAVLSALALIGLASMVGAGPLPFDLSVRDALHVGGPVPLPLDVLNTIGGALVWDAGVAILLAAMWLAHRRMEAVWIGGGVVAGEVLSVAIKLIVDRQRPPGIAVIDLVTQASFPSGHTTRAVITGALLVLFWPGGPRSRIVAGIVAIVVAVLMGLARIVAGEHWPTDVLGAYLVAAIVVAGFVAIRARFTPTAPAHRLPSASAPDDAGPSP